ARHAARGPARTRRELELDARRRALPHRRLFRIHARALGGRKALWHLPIAAASIGRSTITLDDFRARTDARASAWLGEYRPADRRDAGRAYHRERPAQDRARPSRRQPVLAQRPGEIFGSAEARALPLLVSARACEDAGRQGPCAMDIVRRQ